RHQRRRHAGKSDDVRAPAILGNRFDFDEVVASCNGFSEAMNGVCHGCGEKRCSVGVARILRCRYRRSSEATAESARTTERRRNFERDRPKKISVSIPQQEMHQRSTGFPQDRSTLDVLSMRAYAGNFMNNTEGPRGPQ